MTDAENVEVAEVAADDEIKAIVLDAKFKAGKERKSEEVTELRVPANSTVEIDFRLRWLLRLHVTEIALSIKGDQEKKPLAIGTVNSFIKVGQRKELSPDTDENHYIDYNDTYRINSSGLRPVSSGAGAIGYRLETRDPGEYPIVFKVKSVEGGGISGRALTLIVE